MSNFGPALAVGDVNGDELDDFYFGGASGQEGVLFLQTKKETFQATEQISFIEDRLSEDMDAVFFDANNDQHLDLYVVSGGNEFSKDDPALYDRLYLNNGQGIFTKSNNLIPEMSTSGACVTIADYDKDGDQDIFVGGRLIPRQYPLPASSHLLRNDNGKFTDLTEDLAPDLLNLGLVTDAVWTDFDSDGATDLVIVGEWMPIRFFKNEGGILNKVTNATLDNTKGWYYSIIAEDFDKDGDIDFVAGNMGLNYKYKASIESPFELYTDDFDNNGMRDIVLSYYEDGELVPLRGRSCSAEQIPGIGEKFPTYASFGAANLRDVYGEKLDDALNLKATTFASSYLENIGSGEFKIKKLPQAAQVSSINTIIAKDFNEDGHLDLLLAGNLYPVEIETPRNDASIGLYMTGDGKGNFLPIPWRQSGFFAPHDVKQMKLMRLGKNNKPFVLVANNNYWIQAIGYKK